jgi:hypothetical protein
VVHGRLDRLGRGRDPARAQRLEPGQRPLAVDRGHRGQRGLVPRLREGRLPRRPARPGFSGGAGRAGCPGPVFFAIDAEASP